MDQSVTVSDTLQSCQHCNKQSEEVLRCTHCRVAYYCSTAHQSADWPLHKASCRAIKAASNRLDREERALRELPPDEFMMVAVEGKDAFDSAVGHFWGITETRDYMRARSALILALCNYGTRPALQSALDHQFDCFRLCRSDNMGLREETPSLQISLDKDQEAYDFMKWWATCDPNGRYDWGNLNLPYLNLVGADALEPVTYFLSRHRSLPHLVAMALLKYRMLRGLQDWNSSRVLITRLPGDVVNRIAGFLEFSSALPSRSTLASISEADIQELIEGLHNDFDALFKNAHSVNKNFWPCLLNPEPVLSQPPPQYTSSGTMEEVYEALRMSLAAWRQTEGAIDKVRVSLLEGIGA